MGFTKSHGNRKMTLGIRNMLGGHGVQRFWSLGMRESKGNWKPGLWLPWELGSVGFRS